jgi:hypothetical protein
MFAHGMKESREKEIEFRGTGPVAAALLKYLYTGQCDAVQELKTHSDACALMEAAHYYGLPGLMNGTQSVLLSTMTPGDAIATFQLLDTLAGQQNPTDSAPPAKRQKLENESASGISAEPECLAAECAHAASVLRKEVLDVIMLKAKDIAAFRLMISSTKRDV